MTDHTKIHETLKDILEQIGLVPLIGVLCTICLEESMGSPSARWHKAALTLARTSVTLLKPINEKEMP